MRPSDQPLRRRAGLALLALSLLGLSACAGDGHFELFGYTTRPNYDTTIKTVYVPTFKNLTFRRYLEEDLTHAVIREIHAKTPYRVISDRDRADTELLGTIVSLPKNLVNRNQLNEVREAETVLGVQIVWKDVRSGKYLSQPDLTQPPPPPFDPLNPPPPPPLPQPVPAAIQSLGRFIPEVGESTATGFKMNVDRMAIQIVSMMEKPW